MTNRNRVRLSQLSLGLAIALAAAPAFAQNTTAAVGGRIVAADAQPVAGAQVTILHVPSGTVSTATTTADGRYAARGLRVGGPYTITIVKDGVSEVREGVYLQLADTTSVDATLGQGATTLATVEVTGTAVTNEIFSAEKMGAGTNVNRDQLESLPSIERNLQDFARVDPRVVQTDKSRNEISVGGQNPRYNVIRIDGISTNDSFGLESNSLPTPKQPFSMDVIDEIAIDVANYDVTISGGTGGVINAVTKSGTNDFAGTVYGLYRDNSMVRENENGTDFNGFEDETTYGLTFGGPLIKDRLFFFLNYEKYEQGAPGPIFGPVGSGASNIVNVTDADITRIQQIAQGYGFDAGAYGVGGADTTSEEFGLKIDWNITDRQRANFRIGTSDQSVANFPGFGTNAIALSTYAYQRDFVFDTYAAQLFSDWTDSFSTEAKISYRDYSAVRTPVANLPAVAVRVGNATVNFGTEENTHANILETETWNAYFAGNLFVGDHSFKFGVDYENNDIYNLFGRRSNGVYTFNSIDEFESGEPSRFQYFYPAGGDRDNTAAIWGIENLGLFVQDTWAVNYNLTLTFGIRYDEPMIDEAPTYNAAAQAAFGFNNSATIDGNGLFQPRFGFNYTFDAERPTQLRGGFGLFQGSAANVWLSNPFTNTGFGYVDYFFSGGLDLPCATDDGRCFSADPDGQLVLIPAGAREGTQSIDFVDPDLGQPSVWKANLAFDHELPWKGIVMSAEVVLTNVKEAIFYQQLNLGAPTAIGQDGREIYWNAAGLDPTRWNQFGSASGTRTRFNANPAFTDAIIARPTGKGESEQLSLSFSKPRGDWGFSWTAAYTYTDAEEVSPLTSSTSGSQWGNINTFNPNEEVSATSSYEIKDRFSAAISWEKAFFGDYDTRVSMFAESRSGRPFSYVFDNDANGDGRFGNDLLYVPTGPGDVLFNNPTEEAAFWAFIASDGYLNANRGRVVDRNGARNPWVNQFDIKITQELPGFFEGHRSEIWLDILNVGNLINKDWGRIEEIGFPGSRGVVEYGGIDAATGKYVYRFNTPDTARLYDDRGISRWSLQVGFRYKF
ncbi:MAG TPA: carboxypeptidase regulatory-like domain-containing protein [Arenimonas sp.]|uniref:TonB-dependent receptor n=1 Tax=Arenimonas sp. TaxID=1872635 RepID=UPI002D7ED55B|nr:carboxypeptidase regulatory-like domain-containing protein [Arenimonas sp.]HEU0153023.1 carboxypeptidase regulatory-like domain-containing protein [Arenimonas sp.]